MKTAIPLFALITCAALGAEPAPAPLAVANEEDASAQPGPMVEHAVQEAAQGAQKAMQAAQLAMSLASEDLDDAAERATWDLELVGPAARHSGGSLIVRSSAPEAAAMNRIQEDLTVMERILTKAAEREVGREGRDAAMGIVLSTLPGSRRPQSLYLEGYGALFLLNVKFPLVAPPAKGEEKAEKPTDTTWEQTKRELYGPRSPRVQVFDMGGRDAVAEYDAEQVEGLKKALLEALKNATNIRDVKSEESITVVVTGSRASAADARIRRSSRLRSGNVRQSEIFAVVEDSRGSARESTLTLRVSKADVDAFARGSIDFDQFQKRVSVAAY